MQEFQKSKYDTAIRIRQIKQSISQVRSGIELEMVQQAKLIIGVDENFTRFTPHLSKMSALVGKPLFTVLWMAFVKEVVQIPEPIEVEVKLQALPLLSQQQYE